MMTFSHRGIALDVPHLKGGVNKITYLLDANFGNMSDTAAPLASPFAVDVGELTFVQIDGQFSISGGELVIPAQTTPAWGDLGFYEATGFARGAGLTLLGTLTLTTWEECGIAWHSAGAIVDPDNTNNTQQANTADGQIDNVSPLAIRSGLSISIAYPLVLVACNLGAKLYAYIDGVWILLWVDVVGADTTIYPMFANLDGVATMSLMRLASLADNASYPVPALGTRDLDLSTPGTGNGTSSIAAPAGGNTFVHTADTEIIVDITTMVTLNQFGIFFRGDSVNGWKIRLETPNSIKLQLWIGGGLVGNFITASGVVTSGDTLVALANGNTYELYINSSLVGSYTDPTNALITKTTGVFLDTGDGVFSQFEARTLDGIANVASSNHPGLGVATDVLPGPLAANDEATRELTAWCEIMISAIPSAGTVEYAVRYIDVNNFVYLEVDTAGDFDLREVTAGGASTSLATNAAGIGGGERLIFKDYGTSIEVLHGTTLAINQATTLHNTATKTRVLSLGTGGWLGDAINIPLNPASAPNTPEAATIKAAFDLMATP